MQQYCVPTTKSRFTRSKWFNGELPAIQRIATEIPAVSQTCWTICNGRPWSQEAKQQLTLLYKIVNDLIDIPAEEYLSPSTTRTRSAHRKKYRQFSPGTDTFKYSFFPRTVPIWNSLPASLAEAPSLVSLKGVDRLNILNEGSIPGCGVALGAGAMLSGT